MTRFARAHGSKSSNERLPEPATSWDVMKQQLKNKLQSSEANADSTTTSQKIWKSSDFDRDVWNKNEVKWADLEDNECAHKAVKSGKAYDKLEKKNKKKKHNKIVANEHFPQTVGDSQKKRKKNEVDGTEFHYAQSTGINLAVSDDNFRHACNAEKVKKTKKMKKGVNDEVSELGGIKSEKQTIIVKNNTNCKVSLSNKQKTKDQHMDDTVMYDMSEGTVCEQNGTSSKFTKDNNTKKKLGRKRKKIHDSISDIGLEDKHFAKKCRNELKGKEKISHKKNVQLEATEYHLKKKHKHSENESTIEDSASLNSVKQNFPEEVTETILGENTDDMPSEKHKKKKKYNDNLQNKLMKKHRFYMEDKRNRKFQKKYLHTTVLHMNGKDIEIVKFDGFPVKKEDAENLIQLKKKMIANGIPESEIKATMKLERRKAEKALAREKKKVCFHCRNSGHVLSECPELGKADANDLIGTGICFKCGSTEHKHFECRVTREQEFRYAKCFICNEQGHIARQCPDNPRGLYPKGGACHICGDVTHLKKDCPDLIKEKEEKIIKLQTLSSNPLEALEDDKNTKSVSPNHVNKKRTVKF